MTDSSLLEAVIEIAERAGEAILRVYRTDFEVTRKSDHSPVTAADLAAHDIIASGLTRYAPRLPQLSEEGEQPPLAVRSHWSRYWLIDPLDGTREFVKRNGEFSVNIALVENGVPVMGVIIAPALEHGYVALQGFGAWKLEHGERSALHVRRVETPPTIAFSRSHHDGETNALLRPVGEYQRIIRGSSLKFGLIAEGSADLYARLGPTSEWDTAAGQCVTECAGGSVLTLPAFAPMRYNQRESLINPGFVAFGDRGFNWPARLDPPAE